MLQNLHVKNLALINELEITFDEHLNILTGETGAGKSDLDRFYRKCTWGKKYQKI